MNIFSVAGGGNRDPWAPIGTGDGDSFFVLVPLLENGDVDWDSIDYGMIMTPSEG